LKSQSLKENYFKTTGENTAVSGLQSLTEGYLLQTVRAVAFEETLKKLKVRYLTGYKPDSIPV
jgi:hypothetical protein